MTRAVLRFLRRGQIVELADVPPMCTVLDYLRLTEKSKGTKEGCNEGDCGACTVALGTVVDGELCYTSVNACIMLLGQLEGKELVTVDDLAVDGGLHPVQQAMVDTHGSQCGFCTPGFVMSLFTLYHSGIRPTRQQVVDHIAGNLCRCTGYRPIVDAALSVCTGKAVDAWNARAAETVHLLDQLSDREDLVIPYKDGFFAAPASVESLAALAVQNPDAVILAGSTDVGLWITKQLRTLPKIIHVGRAAGFADVEDADDRIIIGAGASYSDAFGQLASIDPDIGETLRRIGSTQVRNSGTIGGNIANGSPIGDTPPVLIALGAKLHLRHGEAQRSLPLEDFFIAYGKQDREKGELVEKVEVPKLKVNEAFRCGKISKRFDQDISAVMGAFKLSLDQRVVIAARVAFGGMAATPKRGEKTEAALAGLSLDRPEAWAAAVGQLAQDYQPISDMRASAEYRLKAAQGLLLRALHEIAGSGEATRVVGVREAAE